MRSGTLRFIFWDTCIHAPIWPLMMSFFCSVQSAPVYFRAIAVLWWNNSPLTTVSECLRLLRIIISRPTFTLLFPRSPYKEATSISVFPEEGHLRPSGPHDLLWLLGALVNYSHWTFAIYSFYTYETSALYASVALMSHGRYRTPHLCFKVTQAAYIPNLSETRPRGGSLPASYRLSWCNAEAFLLCEGNCLQERQCLSRSVWKCSSSCLSLRCILRCVWGKLKIGRAHLWASCLFAACGTASAFPLSPLSVLFACDWLLLHHPFFPLFSVHESGPVSPAGPVPACIHLKQDTTSPRMVHYPTRWETWTLWHSRLLKLSPSCVLDSIIREAHENL